MNIDIAEIFSPIDSSRRVDHYGALIFQNRMKNAKVMAV